MGGVEGVPPLRMEVAAFPRARLAATSVPRVHAYISGCVAEPPVGEGAVNRLRSVVAAFANASEGRVPGRGGSQTCGSNSYMYRDYGLTLNEV